MKARKTKSRILARKLPCVPFEFHNNNLPNDCVIVQSVYGSRTKVKVSQKFFDYVFREKR